MKTNPKIRSVVKQILIVIIVGIAAGVAVVKLDTKAAALFTDNFLRPIVGNKPVGWLEKVYYNTNDKFQQLTDKTGVSSKPQYMEPRSESALKVITPLAGLQPVVGEGVWLNRELKLFPGKEVMAYTFIRPDITRPFAYVTLVQVEMTGLRMGAVAGTSQPGGPVGNPGPGKIPGEIIDSGKLVAAFDGGFQYRDGEFGMIVGNKTYLPLKPDLGTLIGYEDGNLKIINYRGENLTGRIAFIRQNCPILIENGKVFALDERNKRLWGRTFNSDILTWRSGIGLTPGGNIIYAVGNNLSPQSLAQALKMAGAENAIQLDINPFWVRFNIFDPKVNGGYSTTTLTKNLTDGSKGYLNGYSKDFFYIYKK